MVKKKTYQLTAAALVVALLAVCSWISIPLPGTGVPVNLGTFAVILAGLILGKRNGVFAVAVFLLLGAAGLPVFHSFTGGPGILFGPTGGFLFGYLALAFAAGVYGDRVRFGRTDSNANAAQDGSEGSGGSARSIAAYAIAVIIGEAVLYALGTLWYMHAALGGVGVSGLAVALLACVVPFIPGDAVKVIIAYIIYKRLSRVLK